MTDYFCNQRHYRPLECAHCNVKFAWKSVLAKHIRVHTGKKPFGCKGRARRFAKGSNLARHLRSCKILKLCTK
ncbi:Protein glass [Frankliniella fusca]|uniref:Protein glass n=1 Tax=Frankliniella fusca TaxID=407009 RepID=A0AAE1LE39_9NEOP|nr:Protein glass [Frankliniella fusca]